MDVKQVVVDIPAMCVCIYIPMQLIPLGARINPTLHAQLYEPATLLQIC